MGDDGYKETSGQEESDEVILDLYFDRDEDAISLTDKKYGPNIYRLSYRILADREDADENHNDTLLKTWRTIPPVRPLSLLAYLLRICRNTALNRLDWKKAKKRRATVVALSEEMEMCIPDNRSEEEISRRELERLINAFLMSVPEDQRNIFLRRFFSMEPVSHIAESFDFSEGKVSTILWRLKKRLRDFLETEGGIKV